MFRLGKFSQLKEEIMTEALNSLTLSNIKKDAQCGKVTTHALSPTKEEIQQNVDTLDKDIWQAVDYIEKDKAAHEAPTNTVEFSPRGDLSPDTPYKTLSPKIK